MRGGQAGNLLRGEVAGLASKTIFRQASVLFTDYPLRTSCSVGAVSSLSSAIHLIDQQHEQIEPSSNIRRVFRSLDRFVWENYNSVPELHRTLSVLIRLQGLSFREQKIEMAASSIFASADTEVSGFRNVPQSKGVSILTAHWTNSSEAEKDRDWFELRQELLRREQTEDGADSTKLPRASLFGSIWRGVKRKAARSLMAKPPLHPPLHMTRPLVPTREETLDLLESLLLTSKDVFDGKDELWNSGLTTEMLRHFGRLAQDQLHKDGLDGLSVEEAEALQRVSRLVSGSSRLNKACPDEHKLMRTVAAVCN